jgi:hydrogenase expression/formation protein HypD
VLQARAENIDNYYIQSLHKICPPVMKAILDLGEVNLSGIICPGHVSAIIGSYPYRFIPESYRIACAISGFEPIDMLLAVDMLVGQIENDKPEVEIAYRRGVKPEGNTQAVKLMESVFKVADANWRGIETIPASGLQLKSEYEKYDAEKRFEIEPGPAIEPQGCICGSILRGISTPLECKLFRRTCTPENPVGPCMVSSEGSCATYYQYQSE